MTAARFFDYRDAPKPKVLIFGDNSYLGPKLAQSLLSQNCEIFFFAEDRGPQEDLIEDLGKKEDFHRLDESEIDHYPRVNFIFHLAHFPKNQNREGSLDHFLKARRLLDKSFREGAKYLISIFPDEPALEAEERKAVWHIFADLVSEYQKEKGVDARMVLMGDVYGEDLPRDDSNEVTQFLYETIEQNQVTIHGDGLARVWPIYVNDALYSLQKALFAQGTAGKIFNIAPIRSVTLLSLAYHLQRAMLKLQKGPSFEIIFTAPEGNHHFPDHKFVGKTDPLAWEAKTDLAEGVFLTIKSMLEKLNQVPEPIVARPVSETRLHLGRQAEEKFSSRQWNYPLIFARTLFILTFLVIWLAIGYPLLEAGVNTYWGVKNLGAAQNYIFAGNFPQAKKTSARSQENFNRARGDLGYSLFFQGPKMTGIRNWNRGLDGMSRLAASVNLFAQSFDPLSRLGTSLRSDDIDPRQEYSKAQKLLTASLLEAQAGLAMIQGNVSLPLSNARQQRINRVLVEMVEKLDSFSSLFNNLPGILAFEGSKKYLILLQNNMEQRPGGGFIGSYALVSLERGKLKDLQVSDVYTIDGQLREVIEPPAPLKKILGAKGWFLRDSNWTPDYPINARIAANFFQKEAGVDVDGVFAFDLTFMQDVLEVMGEVDLPDYGERIGAKNLFEKGEFYSEVGFYPGSTAKRDFLSALTRKVLDRLLEGKNVSWAKLWEGTQKGLDEKHLLLFFEDGDIQAFLAHKGWAGTIKGEHDYLLVSDANLGANKANRFLKREIDYQATLDKDGFLSSKIKIVYTNNSETESWPQGRYKNWLKIYVPKGSQVVSVDNGGNQDLKQVEEESFGNFTTFAFLVEVPIRTKSEVFLIYRSSAPVKLDLPEPAYKLIVQKQPGVIDDLLKVEVGFPGYLKAVRLQPKGEVSTQVARFASDLRLDREFQIGFQPI